MHYSTLLSFMADVFRQCYLDGQLLHFGTNQPFPYSLAASLIRLVIEDLNQAGRFSWQRQALTLPTPQSTAQGTPIPPYWAWQLAPLEVRGTRIHSLILTQQNLQTDNTHHGLLHPQPPDLFTRQFPTNDSMPNPSGGTSTGGEPTLWCVVQDELRIAPRNRQVNWENTGYEVTLWHDACLSLPETLTSNTPMPVPIEGEALLRYGLMSRLYERLGRLGEAQLAEGRYQSLVKKLRYQSAMPPSSFPKQLPPLF